MKKLINRGAYKSVPQAVGSSKGSTVYLNMKDNPIFVAYKGEVDELKVRRESYEAASAKAQNDLAQQDVQHQQPQYHYFGFTR